MADQRFRPTPRAGRNFIFKSDPDLTSIFGPGISGDALGNSTIGGPVGAIKTCARFRAEQSSPLISILFAFLSADEPGYGAGSGGNWRLRLFADDGSANHFPAVTPLASVDVLANGVTENDREIVFSTPYTTIKGDLYHLVFENTDGSPTTNYFSVNNWVRKELDPGEIAYPRFSNYDWGTAYYFGGNWIERPNYLPIMEIEYGNGSRQGMCYGEASYACPEDDVTCFNQKLVGEINGESKMVRERFTITGEPLVVTGFGLRVLRAEGTISDLYVSLRDEDNMEIETVRLTASSIMTGPAPTYGFAVDEWDDLGHSARWAIGNFKSVHSLVPRADYSLVLSSPSGTYWAWVMRRLTSGYQYSSIGAFSAGFAEYTTNGGSFWLPLGRVAGDSDLQFYLNTLRN